MLASPMLSPAVAVTLMLLPVPAPFDGLLITIGGGGVSPPPPPTVTVTGADVVELPAASRATAVSVCVPAVAVVVFHDTEYGAVVSSAPRFAPSSLNCTPTTPTLSLAVALTVTVPETVEPPVGLVTATLGGVVSPVPPLPHADAPEGFTGVNGFPVQATFLGSGGMHVDSVALGPDGSIYIAGPEPGRLVPVNAMQPTAGGGADSFVARLNPAGKAYIWSTVIGGSDSDVITAIAVGVSKRGVDPATKRPDHSRRSGNGRLLRARTRPLENYCDPSLNGELETPLRPAHREIGWR